MAGNAGEPTAGLVASEQAPPDQIVLQQSERFTNQTFDSIPPRRCADRAGNTEAHAVMFEIVGQAVDRQRAARLADARVVHV